MNLSKRWGCAVILQVDSERFADAYYVMHQALSQHKERMVAVAAKWPQQAAFASEVSEAEAALQFIAGLREQMRLEAA
jgi:hypothetical protein